MANTLTITAIKRSGTSLDINFKVKLTGSYVQVASGGEVLNFPAATIDPVYLGSSGAFPPLSNLNPIAPNIWCTSGDQTNLFQIVSGLLNACILKISTALGTELTAGAYSTLLKSDVLEGQITVNAGI
jgi:hypothetical protein